MKALLLFIYPYERRLLLASGVISGLSIDVLWEHLPHLICPLQVLIGVAHRLSVQLAVCGVNLFYLKPPRPTAMDSINETG